MDATDTPDTDRIDLDAGLAPTIAAKDARVTASAAGIVHAENATLDKSASLAVISRDGIAMSKSAGYWVVAKSVEAENTGSAVMVAGNVKIHRGWVGVLAAPRAEISEDSRVFIGPGAAAIIGLAIVIVFGIAAALAPRLMSQAADLWPDLEKQARDWMREHV